VPQLTQRGRVWSRSHPVLAFAARRTAAGLVTLLVATALLFTVVQLLPGDVANVVLGRNATPEAIAGVHANLGLDQPVVARYARWLGGVVTGDLGESTAAAARGTALPVADVIATPLRNSLVLAGLTFLIVVPLALGLGVLAAVRATRAVDHGISTTALMISAVPEFLIGTLLIFAFFTQLDLLPPVTQIQPGESPFTRLSGLVLPVLTLLAASLAYLVRIVRARTIEVLEHDYVTMARLNGFRESRVLWRYVLRNALAPAVQAVGQTVQYLIGGIIITENVFNYPGIGGILVSAVTVRDVQEITVIAAILGAAYIAVNVVTDLLVVLLVPKLRTQAE
jgi:peptide/nickel transport system permease protein